MPQNLAPPLVETAPDVALAQDYARLRAAFRESVGREVELTAELERAWQDQHRLRQELEAELASMRADRDRLRQELDVMLASPTWRAGRVATALPRLIRDRRTS